MTSIDSLDIASLVWLSKWVFVFAWLDKVLSASSCRQSAKRTSNTITIKIMRNASWVEKLLEFDGIMRGRDCLNG